MAEAGGSRLTVNAQRDREIVMSRTFHAPRQLVFDAWTRAELFVRWFGPRGWTVPVCEMDARPGGAYRYLLRGSDGTEIVMRGTFQEVVPPERLVTTEMFEGFTEVGWRPEDATVNTAIFDERGRTTVWTATVRYPTQEIRDTAFHFGQAWTGLNDSLARLEEVLGEEAAAGA